MEIESSKNLGGVGALLIFIGPLLSVLPGIGGYTGLLSLVGAILVLIAFKGFADYYSESTPVYPPIFSIPFMSAIYRKSIR